MPMDPDTSFDNRNRLRFCILVALFCAWTTSPPMFAQAPSSAHNAVDAATRVKWGEIPLSFEPNLGQESPAVRYLARGSSYTLYLGANEIVLSGRNQVPLSMTLSGANAAPRIVGEEQQVSTSNYFVGNDPDKWRTSVPNYARTRYQDVYPGIDLVYYGHDGTLEYDWIVSPNADPRRIRLQFDESARVRVDKQGELLIETGKTEYRQRKPVLYQEVGGQRIEIAGAWQVRGREAGFRIGAYDHHRPLIIDPVLYYSTYQGGNNNDYANAVAVDGAGNTYLTGLTGSTNFPTTANPLQAALLGAADVFVTKLNATGTARVYSTFLGSTGSDEGKGIAVNGSGEVYVTGSAGFSNFPTKNPIQGTWGGSGDAFLTKLDATGSSLVYSTYLGGSGVDQGNAIALDTAGNAYIVGVTNSTNLPTVNPFQPAKGTGPTQDAFVAKINPAGSAWVYVTYLGGNAEDQGYGIAVDASGNAYVTGETQSTNFPVQSPFRGGNAGLVDAFVTKLNPVGSALVYSTYLGGLQTDVGTAIAVDASGNAYVTGVTASGDFPLKNPIDSSLGSFNVDDAFVAKFNPAGSDLVYSTYLGGGGADEAYAIAIDNAGNAYVTGRTNSDDFPLVSPIQSKRVAFDMFVTEVKADASALQFSTLVGGSGSDFGLGIAVDSLGNIHVAGETTSTDFPVMNGIQMANGGGAADAIVLLLTVTPPSSTALSSLTLKPATVVGGQTVQGVVTLNAAATSPFVVSLSSGSPTLATVPATVTVPTNSTSAEFTVRTSPVTVTVNINITATAGAATFSQFLAVTPVPATGAPPFGTVDTPLNGAAGVTGSIAVTGWALDANGVSGVTIYRNCLPGIDNPAACQIVSGNSVVFIGDAIFVAGARPDVEALYPLYPNSVRAGWGYLMLTNMLPHVTAPASAAGGGQGPLTLFVYATDIEGNRVLLGQRAITLDNDHGVKPFGAIDTPTQGGTASGTVQNYGWALTPGTAMIPTSGNTMTVVVDGVAYGTVTYNLCRGTSTGVGGCHDDIATLFPTMTNITNAIGAIGVYNLDTTQFTNGVHTIAWGVSDNQGRTDGIGSRYFTVQNGSGLTASKSTASTADAGLARTVGSAMDLAWLAPSASEVTGQAGFNLDAPMEVVDADAAGVRSVRVPELGRIELQLGAGTSAGYLNANGTLRPLPPGSQLNTATGQFSWVPGPGYVGTYDLVFVQGSSQVPVEVTIEPKSSITAGLMRGWIDTPSSSSSVSSSFTVAGWALDSAAWHGSGVGAVHVWAQRRDAVGAAEVFLGSASLGGSRPDVAAAYGKQFDRAGWSLRASGLPSGTYDVTAYFWSTRTERFEDARTVTISVR